MGHRPSGRPDMWAREPRGRLFLAIPVICLSMRNWLEMKAAAVRKIELLDQAQPARPPFNWTAPLAFAKVMLFLVMGVVLYLNLGLATTLAVLLVFWYLFWQG